MRRPATMVLGRLSRMGKPVFTTGDAALHLGMTRSAASRALSRLAGAGNFSQQLAVEIDLRRVAVDLSEPDVQRAAG